MHIDRKRFILVLCVIEAIILLLHLAMYETVAHFLLPGDHLARAILAAALFLLSFSFIAAMMIGRRSHAFLTRIFYKVSAVWFGSIYFLVLASALSWIAAGFLALFRSGANAAAISLALFIAAGIGALYAGMNAGVVRVKRLSVEIPDLPESWIGRRIVWASDLHLGLIYGANRARNVARLANAAKPDIFIIGGDLFDGMSIDAEKAVAPLAKVSATFGTYFITGNHEEFGDPAPYLRAIRDAGIGTLIDEARDFDGLRFIGVDYRTSHTNESFEPILKRLRGDEMPAILLKHEPNNLDSAEALGISLQISGHTHRAQMWPFMFVARKAYHGFDYGFKKHHSLEVLVSSGAGTWGPPMRLGTSSEIVVVTLERAK